MNKNRRRVVASFGSRKDQEQVTLSIVQAKQYQEQGAFSTDDPSSEHGSCNALNYLSCAQTDDPSGQTGGLAAASSGGQCRVGNADSRLC